MSSCILVQLQAKSYILVSSAKTFGYISSVINKNCKQYWSQQTTLWDITQYICFCWPAISNAYPLSSLRQKVLNTAVRCNCCCCWVDNCPENRLWVQIQVQTVTVNLLHTVFSLSVVGTLKHWQLACLHSHIICYSWLHCSQSKYSFPSCTDRKWTLIWQFLWLWPNQP